MKRFQLTKTVGPTEDVIYFDDEDIRDFPLPYADQCAKLNALAIGDSVPFGRGTATRIEDEE